MCKAKYGGESGDTRGTGDLEESAPSLWGCATLFFYIPKDANLSSSAFTS